MAAEDCHLLTVSTVGSATSDLTLLHTKLLGEGRLQTGSVQTSQCGDLSGFQTRVQQGYQTSQVGGVEDDDYVLHVRAVLLDVLSQLLGNLTVAGEQVLTGHTSLTGSTTGRDDVLSVLESLLSIGGGYDVHIVETTLAHLLGYTLWREYVIETDLTCQTHHQGGLCHVRTNHTGCADDGQFVVC